MELVTEPPRRFVGLTIVTSNEAETDPETAQIFPMWTKFMQEIVGTVVDPGLFYGVYNEYESDQNGRYRLSATVELPADKPCPDGLHEIKSLGGTYMVFHGSGTMPDIVFQTWSEIWDYFAEADCPHQRAFGIDYEVYPSETEVSIYVSIK